MVLPYGSVRSLAESPCDSRPGPGSGRIWAGGARVGGLATRPAFVGDRSGGSWLAAGAGLGIHAVRRCQAPPAVPEDTLVRVVGQVVMGPEAGAGAGRKQEDAVLAGGSFSRRIFAGGQGAGNRGRGRARSGTRGRGGIFCAALSATRFANPGLPDGIFSRRLKAWTCSPASGLPRISRSCRGWSSGWQPRRLAFRLRSAMARVINQRLTGPAAAFVRTMVLGERTEVSARGRRGFSCGGATHVRRFRACTWPWWRRWSSGCCAAWPAGPQMVLAGEATALAAALSLPR